MEGVSAMPEIGQFAVAADQDGLLEIAAIAGPGPGDQEFTEAVWLNQQVTTDEDNSLDFLSSWQSLGEPGYQLSSIGMARNLDRRLEIVLAANGTMMHSSRSASDGSWSAWESLGHPAYAGSGTRITLAQNQDGRLEVFAASGFPSKIWHSHQKQPGHGPWTEWQSIGSPPPQGGVDIRAPAIARNKDGRLEAYVAVGTEIWHTWQTSAGSD